VKNFVFDLFALLFIYFIPTLSHLLSLPLYFIEPMRIMMVLALVHTNKRNAYIIAFTLPLFSTLISFHPVFVKTLLISAELCLNVFLFYYLTKWIKNSFFNLAVSIIISKVFYYFIKFLLIHTLFLDSTLISTPFLIQFIMIVILSSYVFFLTGSRLKVHNS
ncbi:hypothetical protein ACFL6I_26495, partial [candidate division KSB1 bacterium]